MMKVPAQKWKWL